MMSADGFGRLAQLVAHPLDVREVTSSSLVSSTTMEKSELNSYEEWVRISCVRLIFFDLYIMPNKVNSNGSAITAIMLLYVGL